MRMRQDEEERDSAEDIARRNERVSVAMSRHPRGLAARDAGERPISAKSGLGRMGQGALKKATKKEEG